MYKVETHWNQQIKINHTFSSTYIKIRQEIVEKFVIKLHFLTPQDL